MHGRIVRGARADLLLVRVEPNRDIKATRHVAGIWKIGFSIVLRELHAPDDVVVE